MPEILTPEVRDLLADSLTVKILATTDGQGHPHAVVKHSLHLGENGRLHLLELLESSSSNRNLLRALWFGGHVAISLSAPDGRSVQIKGRPVKTHITGPLFLRHYQEVRARHGDIDLAAVWEIEPDAVTDQSFGARKDVEDALHPAFIHLDRLAV